MEDFLLILKKLGFGCDNTRYENEEHPTKFDLDLVSKEIPIFVSHASGHIATTNSTQLMH